MKRRKWLLGIALLSAVVLGFVIYAADYYRASDFALACFEGDDGLRVKHIDGLICVEAPGSMGGLVFYPGGKVQAEAYLPLLRRIARDGIDCYLVNMPFNLALFGINRASDVMSTHPHERWVLAGHSLGGAMASLWASGHPGELDGLALLAAYPIRQLPEDLPVLLLYGSEDGVLNRSRLEKSASLLPSDAVMAQLPGGNHAWFGSYGEQWGDGAAKILPEAQWDWTAEWIVKLFNE